MDMGSEVHLDMYDDRLEIYSPGGMFENDDVQNLDIMKVPSRRRNPVIADIFARLELMERRGSGFKKIIEEYESQHNYSEDKRPAFYSDPYSFFLTLKNLNYGVESNNGTDDVATPHDAPHDMPYEERKRILVEFCSEPRTRLEMMEHIGFKDRSHFSRDYLKPLLKANLIKMTLPDKPQSKKQKYVATGK